MRCVSIATGYVALVACLISVAGCGRSEHGLRGVLAEAREEPDSVPRYVSDAPKPVTQQLGVVFGDQLELVGISVPSKVTVGEAFEVEQVWHCLAASERDWRIAMLLDHAKPWWRLHRGHVPPLRTTFWKPGHYVSWKVEVTFPEEAPPGRYSINIHPFIIVSREEQKLERLPVTDEGSARFGEIELVSG